MNLIPVNQVCRNITGDVATLPSLSGLAPLFLGREEQLVVSSEDVRCFFYIFKIPVEWEEVYGIQQTSPFVSLSCWWCKSALLPFFSGLLTIGFPMIRPATNPLFLGGGKR